ncbi:MAG: DNA mismatch repair protein MutS [Flavobacteriaceae bacterium]|nr:DNA mismatch repair protein MutS [Flavobacteriaceae bacterium]
MKQYNDVKVKYPGALLLFRVGDFYETFGEDAKTAAGILGITLTKRANGAASHIELAGFPHHSLDTYLPKLVRAGQRVAVCDQLEDPKLTKTIVKRGVTELVSPGVSYNDKVLDQKTSNYLASVYFEKDKIGVSFIDISTGEFLVAEGNQEYIDKLLQGLKPSEIILSKPVRKLFCELFGDDWYIYPLDEWIYSYDHCREKLLQHFGTANLKGFGVDDLRLATVSAGASLQYLNDNQHTRIAHLSAISRLEEEKYMWLDRFTIRNLELLHPQHERGVALFDILDQSCTPMGSRLLRRWLTLPLKDLKPIQDRLSAVECLYNSSETRMELKEQLSQIGDLERLTGKVAMSRLNPRETLQIHRAVSCIPAVVRAFMDSDNEVLRQLADRLNPCLAMVEKIGKSIKPEPPIALNRGSVIADGVNIELDELRQIAFAGKDYLTKVQQRESERTLIPSLKVSFNNVFGYYIEVTNAHKNKVPPEWIRKQTLTSAERYITPELKEYEEKILGAEEKIGKLEEQIYNELLVELLGYVGPLQQNAITLAQADCLLCFAEVSVRNNYTKPQLDEGYTLLLKDCRHPVIEKQLPSGESYIPNDIYLDRDDTQVIILTGPNMSGKSALLRQTALSVIMAQAGCFVPCSSSVFGLVDKVFTRVGASDNLSAGESTFMVEMQETASILNNLSDRSLILLDEIGRGTSTYDGVSLAWSISEYLNKHKTKPKTLFATHYHELNELESRHKGIRNFYISLKESGNKIIFLRKLLPGGSEHSFGIHVARMAGIPIQVIDRAGEILSHLEAQREGLEIKKATPSNQTLASIPSADVQLSMFSLDDPLLVRINEELRKLDVNSITPVEALMKLHQIKELLDKV